MKHIMTKSILLCGLVCSILFTGCSDDDEALGVATITISSFTPAEGFTGTEVTITGADFTENSQVFFNETEVEEYISRSATSLIVRVPDNASSGRIGIVDGNAFGFSEGEFTYIPSAVIESISTEQAPVGETITINGSNFFDVGVENIRVLFGSVAGTVISATSTNIMVIVPEGAEDGAITVQFGDIQTIAGPEFTVGTVQVSVPDYLIDLSTYETGGGDFAVDDTSIGSTRNGAWVMYPVTPEADGLYELRAEMSTNQSYNVYVNIDMGTDAEALEERQVNNDLTQQVENLGGWTSWGQHTYGPFRLTGGRTYYVKLSFLADGTSWVCNLTNLTLHYADDQTVGGIDVDNAAENTYVLYANDFNEGDMLLPFTPAWAWEPNYIWVENQYAEFYYNQAALDADNRRERRGCELTCDFATTSEGWYGYKIYLPEGSFPKDVDGSIITQIFNNGPSNTWAGHLHINGQTLYVGYRGSAAAEAEIDEEIADLEWDKWIPVVVNFRAGRNNQGHLRVWVGDNISEDAPTLELENINLGFGNWIDDNTLDGESYLGCKFGLYVSSGGDRTIRFDDLKALEGNPDGAFDIVKPSI